MPNRTIYLSVEQDKSYAIAMELAKEANIPISRIIVSKLEAWLESFPACSKCDKRSKEGFAFCPWCGAKKAE